MREQFYATYPEDHELAGQEITREATCECGAKFTQRIFSERFLSIVESAKAIGTTAEQIPGLWVPVHCPPCERVDIRQRERIGGAR